MADEALGLLSKLEAQINENSRIEDTEKDSANEAIGILRTNINDELNASRKGPSEDQIEGIGNLIDSLTSITDNFENFSSGDALSIVSGAVNIVGSIGSVVAGPFGPLVAAGCGLISSILSLFGGGGPSLTDQIDKIIRDAIEDFKDEAIYDKVIGQLRDIKAMISELIGIAQYNGGIMKPTEQSFLADTSFADVANDVLGVLEGELSQHLTDTDEKKCTRLAKYVFFYSNISLMKTILLNIHCGLLRRNDMEAVYSGVNKFLNSEMRSEDIKVLGFMKEIPGPESTHGYWWMLYRQLHSSLSSMQRTAIVGYCTEVIGMKSIFPGKLVCIYNIQHGTYNYAAGNYDAQDDDRRNVFRWTPGNAAYDSLWRIIDKDDGSYAIYSEYWGEYLYASESTYNPDRRYCWTWRPGGLTGGSNEGLWHISGDWESDCTIKNAGKYEYYYGSGINYDDDRAFPFCWTSGDLTSDGHWKLFNISYTDTADLEKPRD